MSHRRLVAVLACRADSTRLYAKPLQNLIDGKTILDQILDTFDSFPRVVSQSVIAISEGIENLAYMDFAQRRGVSYVIGSKRDILSRLLNGARMAGATDVLRVTTECPFMWWEKLEEMWVRHRANGNDVTAVDGCPLGTYFEIIRLAPLLAAHAVATDFQKEACTQLFRDHPERYRVEVVTPEIFRLDIRLTVDYPEDLVVCRRVFEHFRDRAPLVPLEEIIDLWDRRPQFRALLEPYITGKGIWVENEGCAWAATSKT